MPVLTVHLVKHIVNGLVGLGQDDSHLVGFVAIGQFDGLIQVVFGIGKLCSAHELATRDVHHRHYCATIERLFHSVVGIKLRRPWPFEV